MSALTGLDREEYDDALKQYVAEHKEIECALLIDEKGFQISDTVLGEGCEITPGYTPAIRGVNHDIKNYFYAIKEQIEDPFISGWYISAATGKNCKTISSHLYGMDGRLIVVCVDLKRR